MEEYTLYRDDSLDARLLEGALRVKFPDLELKVLHSSGQPLILEDSSSKMILGYLNIILMCDLADYLVSNNILPEYK